MATFGGAGIPESERLDEAIMPAAKWRAQEDQDARAPSRAGGGNAESFANPFFGGRLSQLSSLSSDSDLNEEIIEEDVPPEPAVPALGALKSEGRSNMSWGDEDPSEYEPRPKISTIGATSGAMGGAMTFRSGMSEHESEASSQILQRTKRRVVKKDTAHLTLTPNPNPNPNNPNPHPKLTPNPNP